jgi:hypothetical protein
VRESLASKDVNTEAEDSKDITRQLVKIQQAEKTWCML